MLCYVFKGVYSPLKGLHIGSTPDRHAPNRQGGGSRQLCTGTPPGRFRELSVPLNGLYNGGTQLKSIGKHSKTCVSYTIRC